MSLVVCLTNESRLFVGPSGGGVGSADLLVIGQFASVIDLMSNVGTCV